MHFQDDCTEFLVTIILAELPQLMEFDISGNLLTDASAEHFWFPIQCNRHLKRLFLNDNFFAEDGMKVIFNTFYFRDINFLQNLNPLVCVPLDFCPMVALQSHSNPKFPVTFYSIDFTPH